MRYVTDEQRSQRAKAPGPQISRKKFQNCSYPPFVGSPPLAGFVVAPRLQCFSIAPSSLLESVSISGLQKLEYIAVGALVRADRVVDEGLELRGVADDDLAGAGLDESCAF